MNQNILNHYLDIMQENSMKKIPNLNKLWIKLTMDISHQKILTYFMMLSIVYYVTMEISMLVYMRNIFFRTLSFSYMLLADYESYIKCQERVSELFKVCFLF
jgi:hypothetical protein